MIEDKLTREERIRLESLAQANIAVAHSGRVPGDHGAQVLDVAARFEQFIKGPSDGVKSNIATPPRKPFDTPLPKLYDHHSAA